MRACDIIEKPNPTADRLKVVRSLDPLYDHASIGPVYIEVMEGQYTVSAHDGTVTYHGADIMRVVDGIRKAFNIWKRFTQKQHEWLMRGV